MFGLETDVGLWASGSLTVALRMCCLGCDRGFFFWFLHHFFLSSVCCVVVYGCAKLMMLPKLFPLRSPLCRDSWREIQTSRRAIGSGESCSTGNLRETFGNCFSFHWFIGTSCSRRLVTRFQIKLSTLFIPFDDGRRGFPQRELNDNNAVIVSCCYYSLSQFIGVFKLFSKVKDEQ